MTTPTTPKVTKLARISLFIAGLTNSPPSGSKSIVLLGQALTVAQVITLLKALVVPLEAVANAKTAYRKAVAAAKALLATNAGLLGALRPALILDYGPDAPGERHGPEGAEAGDHHHRHHGASAGRRGECAGARPGPVAPVNVVAPAAGAAPATAVSAK